MEPEIWKDVLLAARRLGWTELRQLLIVRDSLRVNDLLDAPRLPEWVSTPPSSPDLSPPDFLEHLRRDAPPYDGKWSAVVIRAKMPQLPFPDPCWIKR